MGLLNRRRGRPGPADASAPPPKDPLEPAHTVITVVCAVLFGMLAIGALASLVFEDVDMSVGGPVCVTDPTTSGSSSALDGAFGARPGVEVIVEGPRYCLDDPDFGQRALHTAGTLASITWHWGALLFALLVIRRARNGPFTEGTARGLHALGCYLSIGALMLHAVQGVIAGALLRDMTDFWGFAVLLDLEGLPWMAVFMGVGLISFARLMRMATAMREDLEGVV